MDGLTISRTATTVEFSDAVAVINLFHVVRLDGDALYQRRRRFQQITTQRHHRRKGDPLHTSHPTLHTGACLLTEKQQNPRDTLSKADEQVPVATTCRIYQCMISAYRRYKLTKGRELVRQLIAFVSNGEPAVLTEMRTLGQPL